MAFKDLYKLGQSQTGSVSELGQEIRLDLQLEDNVFVDVGTVFGNVTDDEGNPVEGATIKITDTNYNPLYHGTTDANGDYTINNVSSGNQYFVFAIKDTYDLNQGISFVMQAGQQIERNFILTPVSSTNNCLVAGEIDNEDGDKLQGVTVRLYDAADPENPILLKTTHTNQFGQYTFFDLPQGLYKVSAYKQGYQNIEVNFVIDAPNQVRNINISLSIDPVTKKGTINGIITDKDGNPVQDAFVILFEVTTDQEGKEVLTPIRVTKTNEEGLYLFEQVPQGDYKIKSNKEVPEI